MTTSSSSYIIAYDIPSDNRRTKVARILEDYGARRQWSVFEVLLSDADYAAMRERLVRILDPDVGFMHVERAGRPSLALDLMEPFRPALADRFVLTLVNRKEMDLAADFEITDYGLRLNRQTFRKFLAKWEANQKKVAPDAENWDVSLQNAIENLLGQVLHGVV